MTIKLTKNQADAVEKIKIEQRKMIETIKAHPNLYRVEKWEKPLFELETDDIQRALFDGYEVEPEFKVGDWVYNTRTNKVAQIDSRYVSGMDELWVNDEEFNFYRKDDSRHATESEIAQEKERRTDKKLDKLLLDLSNEERVRLAKKLDGDHE